MPAPNNTPVGNIDFISGAEALSALQRNWQIARLQCTTLTTAFSASTIYGVLVDSRGGGFVDINDNTATAYRFTTSQFFPMGMPLNTPPPGGAAFAIMNSTGLVATVLYK